MTLFAVIDEEMHSFANGRCHALSCYMACGACDYECKFAAAVCTI